MFAKLWRWATREEVEAAKGLNDYTRKWLLKRMSGPKATKYVGIRPLPKSLLDGETLVAVTDADGDGIVWFINGPDGPEEWIDKLPDRVFKVGAYRYDARYTFFNDDGSCPDHTGTSGATVERNIAIKYPERGNPRLDKKELLRAVFKWIKKDADVLRQEIAVREERDRKQREANRVEEHKEKVMREGVEGLRAAEAAEVLAGLGIRCGDCVHPPKEESSE